MNKQKLDDLQNFTAMERRDFVSIALKAAGISALVTVPAVTNAIRDFAAARSYTVQDIINIILKEIPGTPFPKSVDTIKSGNVDQIVTGIVTTMFATIEVIEETAKSGANFIIAHEPTFYNHEDDTNWVPKNHVVAQKMDLLKKRQITIWRFHDYWHKYKPDGIEYGVMKAAGWLPYFQPGKPILDIPSTTLKELAEHLKKHLGIPQLRIIGDLAQPCRRLAVIPGAAGGQLHLSVVEQQQPDVLIVGEVHEWETAEYIRDARKLGASTSLVILGHSVSEEPGMEWLVDWLSPKVPGIKISHIPSGNPFIYL